MKAAMVLAVLESKDGWNKNNKRW